MAATTDAGFPQDISPDHYTIERELGRGGMATVYLARDIRHDRRVALKVFKPDVGVLLGAERFTREVKLAAQLQHPHIVSVYDSGRTPDGTLWFTMPYIEGESLRARLEREKQLSLDDAIRITREIADALATYVHARSGDLGEALAELKEQIDQPGGQSRGALRVDPNWDFLRSDARFQQLLADSTGNAP